MYLHICLLSDQQAANFIPLFDDHIKARSVVFIVTKQTLAAYSRLESVLKGRQVACSKLDLNEPYSVEATQTLVEQALLKAVDDGIAVENILVNVTGGMKPMAIGAYSAAKENHVDCFYIQVDTLFWLTHFYHEGKNKQTLDNKLKLKNYILLQDGTIRKEGQISTPPKFELVADMLLEYCLKHPKTVGTLNYLATTAEDNLSVLQKKPMLDDHHLQTLLESIEEAGLLRINGTSIHFNDENSRSFSNGGWLEYFAHQALKNLRQRFPNKIQDIQRGLEIEIKDSHHELDLVALVNNAVVIFECKTKKSSGKENDLRNELHRLNTLCVQLGGPFAKGILMCAIEPREADIERVKEQQNRYIAYGSFLSNIEGHLVEWLNLND